MQLTGRPGTHLADSAPPHISPKGGAQGARPSRPAADRGRYASLSSLDTFRANRCTIVGSELPDRGARTEAMQETGRTWESIQFGSVTRAVARVGTRCRTSGNHGHTRHESCQALRSSHARNFPPFGRLSLVALRNRLLASGVPNAPRLALSFSSSRASTQKGGEHA